MFEATRGVSGKVIEAGGKMKAETGLAIRVGHCEDLGFYPEVLGSKKWKDQVSRPLYGLWRIQGGGCRHLC